MSSPTVFDPRKIGWFESWRRRTLANIPAYPLAVQPMLRWILASHREREGSETYVSTMNLENWWVTHDREVKHRIIIVLCFAALLILLLFLGIPQFFFYKGVGVMLSQKNVIMSVCNAPIAKNIPLPRRADLSSYSSAEWKAANPRPFANLTERDFARGFATLSVGWLGGEGVPLHLAELQSIMTEHSQGKRCTCAAHFGVPLSAFSFNGRMFWETYEWLVPPNGANRTCPGFPSLYTQEHAKALVRPRLCDSKKKAAVGIQLSKAELCCLDYCKYIA